MSYTSAAYKTAMSGGSRPAIAVVTGGKVGIGRALAEKIASFPFVEKVLAVSRSISDKDVEGSHKLAALAADVTTEEGRQLLVSTVKDLCGDNEKQLRFLVHGAGVIDPIKPVLEIKAEELRHALNVNCEAPFLLTTALYPYMADDTTAGRVLHVSSGAAHGAPPVGWSVYGISKAAFYQSFKVLEREFREGLGGKVVVGSFKPGVVDTAMQGSIRSSADTAMPAVKAFQNMKAKADSLSGTTDSSQARPPPAGALDTPENVAHFVEYLLVGTTDEEYANKDDANEWDVRNKVNYPLWIPEANLPKEE